MTEKEKKKLESKKKRAAKKKQQLKQEAAVNNSNNAVGGKDKKQAADGEFVPPPIVGEDLVKVSECFYHVFISVVYKQSGLDILKTLCEFVTICHFWIFCEK